MSLNWGYQLEAWEISWSLFSLAFIGVITSILGLIVAGIVSFFQLLVPESTSRPGRALFTGGVAMIGAAAATLALFSNMPLRLSLNLWATAGIAGALVGAAFAVLAYWHVEEV
ncbi:hypothetical protein [Arthrobacter sp. 9V]|uniref:hypothetical protein n=1 Tax=Arthrobacter sp. 9V TaxID=2653132 RepID=UPI001358C953|nr:hypothetical protein [Arthrobacter sp. 9V]